MSLIDAEALNHVHNDYLSLSLSIGDGSVPFIHRLVLVIFDENIINLIKINWEKTLKMITYSCTLKRNFFRDE